MTSVLLFLAVAVSLALYLLFRTLNYKAFLASKHPAGTFFAPLLLPAAFILVALGCRFRFLRQAFSPGATFYRLVDAVLVFFVVMFFIRVVDASVAAWYARRQAPFHMPRVLHGFILVVLYLAVLFAILKRMFGINITPFLATSAILTMILGLALQGMLSNIMAGMSLHFTKSFRRGDWVRVKEVEGVVLETNWRETRLLDRASNVISIPNNVLFSEFVTNFSSPDRKTALVFPVRAAFSAPPARVQEALLETARDVPEILSAPSPQAFIQGYDNYGISYLLKFWVTDFSRKEAILTKVGRLIWYKFQRRGIEIPVPVSDRVADFVRAVRPEESEAKEEAAREDNLRALLGATFLRYPEGGKRGQLVMTEREVRDLAASVRRRKYTAGEVLFRQGDRGESAFVVVSGLLRGEIVYEEKGKKYRTEFRVGPGDIFGEMSLFTGLPRTATGIVEEEAELLEIRQEDFGRLLARHPRLAEVMAGIVAERNRRNADFLAKIKELSAQDVALSCNKKSILERLKGLIGFFKNRA